MILSASRRTDLPNYYSEWFFQRMKEGFLYVRNPMNPHQISEIDCSPEVVDCIVFWTKNPEPMIDRLDELSGYEYYFQFTLTGYGTDIEPNVPHKKNKMIPVFQKLSQKVGAERVIWRYDPILFSERYTPEYHQKAFGQIAEALNGFTNECVISFVDTYAKNKKELAALNIYQPEEAHIMDFAEKLCKTAQQNGMTMGSCAEQLELSACGIHHNCCIDKAKIEAMLGCRIAAAKDKNQRQSCGCIESIDIGTYDTCGNGCRYCYANASNSKVSAGRSKYDPASPLLCGQVMEGDRVSKRKVRSLRE